MFKNMKKGMKGINIKFQDIESGAKEFSYIAYSLADWIALVGISILMSVFLGLIIFKILAVGGLSAVLADLMYSTCTSTNIPCDYNVLLGGIGLSLMVITTFFISTMKLVVRENVFLLDDLDQDEDQPCKFYNEKQIEILRLIQAMKGTQNIRKLSNFVGTPYMTLKNYINLFERDGYIKTHSNGKGTQVEIEVIK